LRYLRLNIFQKNGNLVYLEVPIDDEIANAINASPSIKCEFLVYDNMQFVIPDKDKKHKSEIADFRNAKGI